MFFSLTKPEEEEDERKKCRKIAGRAAAAAEEVVAVGSEPDNISAAEEEQRTERKASLIPTGFGRSLVHRGLQWGSDTHRRCVSAFTPTESLILSGVSGSLSPGICGFR